jgi:small subunit ribosomal protein S17
MSEKAMGATGRTVRGVVTSIKMNKTIVVRVTRQVKHPIYEKILTKFTKLYAHDEENLCQEGDVVIIQETRPISKLKCWKLVELVEKAG